MKPHLEPPDPFRLIWSRLDVIDWLIILAALAACWWITGFIVDLVHAHVFAFVAATVLLPFALLVLASIGAAVLWLYRRLTQRTP